MSNPIFNRIIFILSLAGSAVALYLTLAHLKIADLKCGPMQDCEYVAQHFTAHGFGIKALEAIPTATFGLGMYLFMVVVSFLRVAQPDSTLSRKLPLVQLLVSGFSTAISGWLTYLEAYVIHHWCRYCVASAIIVTLIFITALIERMNRKPFDVVTPQAPEGELS
ncbi:MAG: vitamin K epoxide reductase family protein [Chthonomonadales bacterium]